MPEAYRRAHRAIAVKNRGGDDPAALQGLGRTSRAYSSVPDAVTIAPAPVPVELLSSFPAL